MLYLKIALIALIVNVYMNRSMKRTIASFVARGMSVEKMSGKIRCIIPSLCIGLSEVVIVADAIVFILKEL